LTMAEKRYVFYINHVAILVPSHIFSYPRYMALRLLENICRDYYRSVGMNPYKLAEKIYVMWLTGHYDREVRRYMYLVEFFSKVGKAYDPFFESRTWIYTEGEVKDWKRLIQWLKEEAWYQLITVPSVIIALRKDAAAYLEGYENGVLIESEEMEFAKIGKLYRFMVNNKSDYVFTDSRIKCDLKRLEENIRLLTINVTKKEIIRQLLRHNWDWVVRTLYRVWKVTLNCETNTPMWWWGE